MTKQHLTRTISLLMGMMALMIGLSVSVAQDNQPVFRIGVLDAERGAIANGARLAVKEINESGGVLGAEGTRFRLELVIQPTQEGDTLTEAIERINQARVIAVLGPQTTDEVLSNLPDLTSLNVPILTPALGDTIIASDSTGLLFRTRSAERLLGDALARYLVNELNIQDITTVQLDRNSTAGRVGFSVALSQIAGAPGEETFLLEDEFELNILVEDVVAASPSVVVAYGPPDIASDFYAQLRDAGWVGIFTYSDAQLPEFRESDAPERLRGVLSATTWSVSSTDAASNRFVNDFVRTFDAAPGPIEAATYDSVYLLAEAIGQPGDLLTNLSAVRDVDGVQGVINPTGLVSRETSDTVSVIQLNAFGGFDVIARYAATEPLPEEPVEVVEGDDENDENAEPTATLTPTPEGNVLTIESPVQNVRTGPGLEYEVLGQLRQGEQAEVIGATADFSWVVINFRGQQGWLATYLLDFFGDRNAVPVLAIPPTPTPSPQTLTPTSPVQNVADIVIVNASPSNIIQGVTTNVNVTVRNIGGAGAGPFAVAATFSPDGFFSSVNLPGLAAGTETVISLPVTLAGATGAYQVVIVADLNNQVAEGEVGETNNDDFILNYRVDRQQLLINSTTLSLNASVDLEGNVQPVFDVQYTAAGLNTSSGCTQSAYCIGLLTNFNWDTATYDVITAANGINTTFVPNTSLAVGTTLGVLTSDGRRGVIRVDAINPGVSITLTYRLYQ